MFPTLGPFFFFSFSFSNKRLSYFRPFFQKVLTSLIVDSVVVTVPRGSPFKRRVLDHGKLGCHSEVFVPRTVKTDFVVDFRQTGSVSHNEFSPRDKK